MPSNQTTTLLIGKDPERGCLLVAIQTNGQLRNMFTIGAPMSLPGSVSRCIPQQGIAHCKIDVQGNNMTITNLKWQNVTYVNGIEITTKRIEAQSRVELGTDHYQLNVAALLQASGISLVPEYSIYPLKAIWEDYDRQLLAMQVAERKKANISRLQGIFSMIAMLMAILPSIVDSINIPVWLRVVILVCALGMAVFSFISGMRTSDSFAVKKHQLDEQLYTQYVCPNPKCHHFMGMQPYIVLRQNKVCPYCRCKLTD